MSSRKPVLTAQELEIMKILWRSGASTVRGVYEDLLERRKIAYTTVMTMMNILEQKGYLKKTQKDRVFNGSAEPLLLHLVEDRHVSESDLDEIRRMMREKP